MKITAKLAYSQLVVNHKRTIWTLIGIAISTALITVVCSLVASGSDSVVLLAGDPAQREMLFTVLLVPAIIVNIIIILMSVIVISNGFRVSAGERATQFGILKSTGATKHQIRATVMYESVLLSVVGIPIGIILGLILAFVGVQVSNHILYDLNNLTQIMIQELTIHVNFVIAWQAIVIAILLSFVTVLISAWRPANKASKTSAIDSIRGVGEVKLKTKQLRTNPLVSKLFGFEGTLAAKSIKRSRRNFRASVVSLTIAVVMFVTASGIGTTVGQIEDLMFGNIEATVIVDYVSARRWEPNEETGEWEAYILAPIDSRIADIITERLKGYDDTHIFGVGVDSYSYSAIIPQEMITPEMMRIVRNFFHYEQAQYELSVDIITLDPENYARLAEVAGVPMGSNILLNHYAINDRGHVVVFEPLIFYGQNLQLLHKRSEEIRELEIHGVLTASELPIELYPINPAASVVASIVDLSHKSTNVPENLLK